MARPLPRYALGLCVAAAVITVAGSTAFLAAHAAGQFAPAPVEQGEQFPGGKATSIKAVATRDAFSQSSSNLEFDRELDFKIGNAIFRKVWVSAPASTKSSDGLGPLFNARSCQRCHIKDGRGHPPASNWPGDDAISMLMRLSIPPRNDAERAVLASGRAASIPEPTYGGQLQDLTIQGLDAEGKINITYQSQTVAFSDGDAVELRSPHYNIVNLGFGPLAKDVMISPRIAPPMIGLGLLEAVGEDDIVSWADPADGNGDGVSGRASRVWSRVDERMTLGRFGWKAGAPTLLQQAGAAFANDIGISSWIAPTHAGDCTKRQPSCIGAPHGAGPKPSAMEISPALLKLVVFYSANLAVPIRRGHDRPEVLRGKTIFGSLGCAVCHRPNFTTGPSPGQPHLGNQKIWPYSDLLLHDMGEGLADGRPDGTASGREWRTPPLWGIGLTGTVSGHTFFLHDGRARNLTEAIVWHGGEAARARAAFIALAKQDRKDLLAFINSL